VSQLNIAFLGVGHPHVFPRVRLLRAMPDVTITGFFEPDPGIASQFAQRTQVPHFATADALLDTGPDVAIVNALDPQVPDLAEQAARAGVRGLLLEKPGAASPERFYALARELTRRGVTVEVGYELHYADATTVCREVIAGDVLGDITMARFHGGCPVGAGAELWQSIPEDPGGLVFTEGSHLLEIVVDLFGTPSRVGASVRRLPAGRPTPSVVYKADLFAAPSTDYEEARLNLRAAAGRFPAGTTVLRAPDPPPGESTLIDAYRRQLLSLLARVSGAAGEHGCDLPIGVGVMRIMQAMYEAGEDRRWAELREL
jgi:predicted dehydrogenase